MFDELDTQEIVNLARVVASANGKICRAYGADDIMNTEILRIWDEIEPLAEVRGIVL